MSVLASGFKRVLEWRAARRATLPWRELEAEAARQGCSPADIFFDRAGHADPNEAGLAAASAACMASDVDGKTRQRNLQRAGWRGHDPLPVRRTT
jgi:hypothetical protein